jgi:hypothetical protein
VAVKIEKVQNCKRQTRDVEKMFGECFCRLILVCSINVKHQDHLKVLEERHTNLIKVLRYNNDQHACRNRHEDQEEIPPCPIIDEQ